MDSLLKEYIGKDFGETKAREFEDFLVPFLEKLGKVKRQVRVNNRGDGRTGRVDFVIQNPNETIGIEVDRKSTRKKSIFKLHELGVDRMVVITRSPLTITEI